MAIVLSETRLRIMCLQFLVLSSEACLVERALNLSEALLGALRLRLCILKPCLPLRVSLPAVETLLGLLYFL